MESPTSVLLQYGIAGVCILAEAWVIARLYADNRMLQQQKDTLQESRLQDAKETIDKVSQPLSSISQTVDLVYEKLKASKEA